MSDRNYSIIAIETDPDLSLEELCHACDVTPEFIQELIQYGTIEPIGFSLSTSKFNAKNLRKVRKILNLQQDLEVNVAGAVLALDLMDEIEDLHAHIELLQKYVHIPR